MKLKTDFLIIGAGPFGISMAAYARHLNIDFQIVGKTMEFWKNHMPTGMKLRSGPDWHIDPCDEHTILKFLENQNLDGFAGKPISLDLYLQYTDWFIREKGIEPINSYVRELDYHRLDSHPFKAHLNNGNVVESKTTLIAVGFGYFHYIPEEIGSLIPRNKYSHTSELVDFSQLKSMDCIILGGRQSAFEWASLISEAGANRINVVYRHKTPQFTVSDWSWVNPIMDKMISNPDFYTGLSTAEKKELSDRFWTEGRLKLEPWLAHIKQDEKIDIHPESTISSIKTTDNGRIEVLLNDNIRVTADHLICATGYRVDLNKVPFLKSGNVLKNIDIMDGYPKLGAGLQSSVQGLFFTSMPATQDYGAFFGFTVSCRASAIIIGSAVKKLLSDR